MKIPRWKSRSSRCVYLVGKSPKHASNVPLVLNPSTGAITGQFHTVTDDWFATIASPCSALPGSLLVSLKVSMTLATIAF